MARRATVRRRNGVTSVATWQSTGLPAGITLGDIATYAGYGLVVVELRVTEATAAITRVRGEFREQGSATVRRFPKDLWRISPSDAWDAQRTFVGILANVDTTKTHEIRLTVEDSRDNTAYAVGTAVFRQGSISDASVVTPTHYLRSDAGSDSSNGTAHATAWASLEKLITAFNAAGAGSAWVCAVEAGYYFRPSTTLHNTAGRTLHLVGWKADGSAWNPACDDNRNLTTGPHAVVHGRFTAPAASNLAEDAADSTKGRLGKGPWVQISVQGQGSRYNYTDGVVPGVVPSYSIWKCDGTGVTGVTTAAYSPAVAGGDYAGAKNATPLRVSSWSRTVYTGADSCTDTLAGWAETVNCNPAYNAGVWQDGTTDTVYLLLPGGIDPNTRYVWLGDGTGTDNIDSRQGIKVDTPSCRVTGLRFRALNNGIRVEDDGDHFIADHCVTESNIYGILLNGIGASPPQNWLEDVRIYRCLFLDTNTWSTAADPDTDVAAIPWKFVKSHIGARNALAENGSTTIFGYYPGATLGATTPPTVKLGTATEGDGIFIRRYARYVQVMECSFDGPFNGVGQSIETQWQQAEDRYQGTCVEIASCAFRHIMDNPIEHEGGSMGWFVHDNTYDLCNTCYSLDFNYGPVLYWKERSWRVSNIGIRSDGHLVAPARGTTGGVFKWGGSGDPRAEAMVVNCTYWSDQGTSTYRTGIWADSVSGTANQSWWVRNTIARGMGYVFDDTQGTPWNEDFNLFASGDAGGRGHRRANVNYNASGTTGAASLAAYRAGLIFGAPSGYGASTNQIDGTDYNFVAGGVALIDGELRDPTGGDVRLAPGSAVLESGGVVGMLCDRAGTDYAGGAPNRGYRPSSDELATLAIRRVAAFADWCERQGVKGHIGELGWPNRTSDGAQWNRAMSAVLDYCESRNISVVHWATGNNRNGYALSAWQPPSLLADVSLSTGAAPTWERYLAATTQPLSGAFVTGGHNKTPFGGENPSDASTGFFSNVNLGTYGVDYKYDTRATFDFLYARGARCVTISFRWERLQPTLSAALNAAELGRLTTCVNDAIAAGLTVILQPFNKGEYYIHNAGTGKGDRKRIGVDAELTTAMFADLWTRVATAFGGTAGVVGYGLMNEPSTNALATWQAASQAAASAIAAVDTAKTIIVPPPAWFPPVSIGSDSPTAWVTGVANPLRYEGHFYFDLTDGGFYSETYDQASASMATGYRFLDTFTVADVSPIPSGRTGDVGIGPGWTVSKFKIVSNTAAPVDSTTCELYQDARFVDGTWRMVVAAWDTATASREQWLVFRRAWDASFNGWRFGFDSTGVWKLQKTNGAGSYGSISGGNTVSTGTVVPTAGDVVEVVLAGATITCKVNGAILYTATDGYLQGATVGGVRCTAAPNLRVDSVGFLFG